MYYLRRDIRFRFWNFRLMGATEMDTLNSQRQKYVLAGLLGALAGGILVALATKAIPKMMSGMMAGMMKNMMQKGEGNGNLPEI